jgi:hypothetical protein
MKKPVNLRKWGPVLAPGVVMLLGVLGSSCSDDGDAEGGAAGMGGAITAGGGTGNLPAGGRAGTSGGSASVGSGGGAGNAVAGNGGAAGAAGGSMGGGPNGAAGSGPAPEGDAGANNIQHCDLTTACLEFRDHTPAAACQESNAANCANLLSGTYAEGPCPAQYVLVEVEQTFCGPTASFDLPD